MSRPLQKKLCVSSIRVAVFLTYSLRKKTYVPLVDEYVPPGAVEDLALDVDDGEVPVPKPYNGLQGPQLAGQEGPEGPL